MTIYAVNDIYPSIQGEGRMTGTPMVILRLQGCEVGCQWCDTKETWFKDLTKQGKSIPDILGKSDQWAYIRSVELSEYINNVRGNIQWVLLTGGEPSNHNLSYLVRHLSGYGIKVQLETSGTEDGHLGLPIDWVTVSPKYRMPGRKKIIPEVVRTADEIKMVITKRKDFDLLERLLEHCKVDPDRTMIGIQPVSLSEKVTKLCVEMAMNKGWNLSIQTHKYLEID